MASTDEAGAATREAQEKVVNSTGDLGEFVMYRGLPSVEQCREFMAVLNDGRVAAGLDPLDTLEFDKCEPGSHRNCLSARHLAAPLGGDVGGMRFTFEVELDSREQQRRSTIEQVATAIGGKGTSVRKTTYGVPRVEVSVEIPEAIKRVTDPFDRETPGLRDRLVEAGVVAA